MPHKEPEKRRAYHREYNRKYRQTHREAIKLNQQRYRQRRSKHRFNSWMREYNRKIKRQVLLHYGNGNLACVRCGFGDIRALTIDHIDGGGTKERRKMNRHGGYTNYLYLRKLKFPDGYQTLCANCQMIKEFERRDAEPR